MIKTAQRFVRENRLFCITLFVAMLFSFTPLYGIGYLLFLIVFTPKLHLLSAFNSHFSNFILATLMFAATIMISGIFTSLLSIPNGAAVTMLVALLFFGVICWLQHTDTPSKKLFNESDIVAIIAAMIVPVAVLFIQLSSAPLNEALFKIANADGWDNASHLNLLQAVSENNNYFYSTSPIHSDGGELFNNYPQGWHLASAQLLNGAVPGILNPDIYGVSATLAAYIGIVFLWFAAALFVFAKIAWKLIPNMEELSLFARSSVLFIIMILPILGLLMGSLSSGYVNYIGLIPFLLLIVAYSHQMLQTMDKRQLWAYVVFGMLMIAGVYLIWVLPMPPLLALVLLTAIMVRWPKLYRTKTLAVCILAFIVAVSLLGYVWILLRDVGLDQMYVSSTWIKHFPGTSLVLACLLVLAFGAIKFKATTHTLIVLLAPFIVYMFILWLLAYTLSGGLGYYHTKLFGLFFIIVAVFTATMIIRFASTLDISPYKLNKAWAVIGIAFCLVSTLFVVSGQRIELKMLHRSQHYLTYGERAYVARWIASGEKLERGDQLLLLRDDVMDNVNRGMLYNRLTITSAKQFLASASPSAKSSVDTRYTCLMNVHYEMSDGKLRAVKDGEAVWQNITTCVESRASAGLHTTIHLPRILQARADQLAQKSVRLVYY